MPQAVGVIQTVGFPAVLAAADAMVKGDSPFIKREIVPLLL